jgi:O-antigen/teichoic acid export membrane protein
VVVGGDRDLPLAPPGDTGSRPSRSRLAGISEAGGSIAAQGIAAAASLLLQIVAARSLGAAGYGSFTLLFGALVLLAGVHSGFVGDARTVLDRSDPAIRDALATSQIVFVLAATVLAGAGAWASGLTGVGGSALFALLTGVWLFEDAGRRLFMTRLEFWRLVVNDIVYLVVSVGALLALRLGTGELTLEALLLAMTLGALAAVTDAAFALPSSELRFGRSTAAGLRTVARFASWRSAHAGIRPLATLLLRTLVSVLASAAALGQLEAARLAVAPIMIVVNGLGFVLLARYSVRARKSDRSTRSDAIATSTWVLVSVCLVFGGIVTIAASSLMPLLTGGGDLEVDRWAVAGWSLFAVTFAAGIPVGTSLLARQHARLVFRLRVVDSAVGLAVGAVLIATVGPSAAPYGLAVGAAIGALMMWAAANRHLPRTPSSRGHGLAFPRPAENNTGSVS